MSPSNTPSPDNAVYLSLGSNLGDRMFYLRQAISLLNMNGIKAQKISPVYETDPVEYTDQGKFLNCCLLACTALPVFSLLDTIHNIEKQLSRTRHIRFGPRTIDIDILLYNKDRIISDMLTLPHPRMFERAFVLVPLAQIIQKNSGAYCKTMSIVYDHAFNKSGVKLYNESI